MFGRGRVEKSSGRSGFTVSLLTASATFGLFVLVAIPLPGTGAWTGALVASLLDLRMKSAVPAIGAGVAAAGVIVLLVCKGVIHIAGLV